MDIVPDCTIGTPQRSDEKLSPETSIVSVPLAAGSTAPAARGVNHRVADVSTSPEGTSADGVDSFGRPPASHRRRVPPTERPGHRPCDGESHALPLSEVLVPHHGQDVGTGRPRRDAAAVAIIETVIRSVCSSAKMVMDTSSPRRSAHRHRTERLRRAHPSRHQSSGKGCHLPRRPPGTCSVTSGSHRRCGGTSARPGPVDDRHGCRPTQAS